MPAHSPNWNAIHPSVYKNSTEAVRCVSATRRPSGAIRYRCPVTGSFVLITDASTLARMAERDTRLRCMDCGEMHILEKESV